MHGFLALAASREPTAVMQVLLQENGAPGSHRQEHSILWAETSAQACRADLCPCMSCRPPQLGITKAPVRNRASRAKHLRSTFSSGGKLCGSLMGLADKSPLRSRWMSLFAWTNSQIARHLPKLDTNTAVRSHSDSRFCLYFRKLILMGQERLSG